MDDKYDVRLSRVTLLIFFIAGLFFLFAGLEIGYFHKVIGPVHVAPEKQWIYYAFLVCFIGIGGACSIQSLLYLISPPFLFCASAEGISFACGFRYNLFMIPWKYVESVGAGVDLSQPLRGQGSAGLQVTFRKSDNIPGDKPTSMGVSYFMNVMTLNIFYMSRPVKEAMEKVKEMHRKFGGS
jgi:hypothetical protein